MARIVKDGESLEDGATNEFDLVIVGAGMAGITLAERLRGTGQTICVIEGGGFDPETSAQRLCEGENVGRAYFSLERSRFRVFGGSSIRWGGWCRPLDPIDFTARDWIPGSGWPINYDELVRYYSEAADILELETDSFAVDDWAHRIPPPPDFDGSMLEPAVIQHGARVDFGERWRTPLAVATDVTVVLHASAAELVLDRTRERLDHVRVATLRGRQARIRGKTFVLAAGGVENARLLLASGGRDGAGIGNENDHVGRCFMEHLHVASAHLILDPRAGVPPFFDHGIGDDRPAHGVLTPTETALTELRLPSCSVSLSSPRAAMGMIPRLGWPTTLMTASERTARRLKRHSPRIDAGLRRAVLATWKARRTYELRRSVQAVGLHESPVAIAFVRAEQTPNPDSRVTLSTARDALGVLRARLDWRLTPADIMAVTSWTDHLADVCASQRIGRVVPVESWEDKIIGGPHHMGTTRMSASARDGVVDADCRVHTVENLYVAGSSVFTTGGHANPSYTILALTLRLADHLREAAGSVARAAPATGSAVTVDESSRSDDP